MIRQETCFTQTNVRYNIAQRFKIKSFNNKITQRDMVNFFYIKTPHLSGSHRQLSTILFLFFLLVNLVSGKATSEIHNERIARSVDQHGTGITRNLVAKFGKRPEDMYSFGIGKRSISTEEMNAFLEEERSKEAAVAEAARENGVSLDPSDLNDLLAVKTEHALSELRLWPW
ncbi:unnamed protein product [Lepeophtheirus salmonis]|uniref:(salmon louse) hypothetical protein n=1 Tax=Lepeophtheirus salmonis TaxID=72036 RepID=A0A7R8CUG3_LEPSM|nr:unnamed protein product [Lepeophtheirus salmonis]CAF2899799.1 unnamed protein product [Lepeophtheirus salmonis]